MFNPFLENPRPDFDEFTAIIQGRTEPKRVPLIELSMDEIVMKQITEHFLGETWIDWCRGFEYTPGESYFRQVVRLYHHLGYDCAPVWATWEAHPRPDYRVGIDTAGNGDSQRAWTEESSGLIASWADFERFPWGKLQPDPRPVEFAAKYLPAGMKLTANTTFFEHVFEHLLGVEGLSYMLYDEPDLVEAVFESWGQKVYGYYRAVIDHDAVGAIFHADDMGFKTSTLISPDALRRYVLPWLKKFAALAHDHGKAFYLHTDGNLYRQGIMDDLIDDVKIDGKHGFEDTIMSVTDFRQTYGERIATFGGVDMDRLVESDKQNLREYVRAILDANMPGGCYAFGTGNTVANYVPLDRYFILLQEGRRWQP